ncbi:MAG: carboxypeptidase regulatory-like domain-containing protein [Acidobacteria bacterium]|nr:carboxypeptidase regulatory-like domain-containing protein [Acidobacteriota bacterium]
MWRWALAAILTAQVALGCMCSSWPDASEFLAKSEAVFSGRVVSQTSGWKAPYDFQRARAIQEKYQLFGLDWYRLLESDTPSALAIQKEMLHQVAVPAYRRRVDAIRSHAEFVALHEELQESGVWTRFAVTESFKGPVKSTIDVWQMITNCDTPFHPDEQFLIYAHRNREGRLSPSYCGGVTPITAAGNDLRYLRTVKAHTQSSVRFFGQIGNAGPRNAGVIGGGVADPVLGVEVQLSSSRGNWSFTTGPGGGFHFDGLRGGDYTLTVHTLPTSYAPARLLHGPVEITLPARGYLKRNFLLAPDRISKE